MHLFRYVRLLPANYGDGVSSIPVSILGGDLPNAAVVSKVLTFENVTTSSTRTQAHSEWGQILAHDVSRLASRPEQGQK